MGNRRLRWRDVIHRTSSSRTSPWFVPPSSDVSLVVNTHGVLLDSIQPKLDGYGLLAALRRTNDDGQAYIPVILVTARAGEEERVNGLLAGGMCLPFALHPP